VGNELARARLSLGVVTIEPLDDVDRGRWCDAAVPHCAPRVQENTGYRISMIT
jgi:hypothetical protein